MPNVTAEPKIIPQRCVLGEAPVWDPVSATLTWVDCDQKKMFRLDPETDQIRTFELPHSPGSYAFCRNGELILAYRNKLALVELESGSHRVIDTPMIDFATARFNDGACDRAGRFWVGTMDKRMSEPVGALYRVDRDLSVRQMAEGVVVSNGIAFSPDDKTMYHTDSRSAIIYAYDFDIDSGSISNRRIFADFRGGEARPDGCTTDSDGNLWIAMNSAWRVAVLNPRGEEVRSVPLPTSRPTSVCLGGRALDTLYVTSMRHFLSEEDLAAQPEAGSLFAFPVDVRGLPEPYFGGGQPAAAPGGRLAPCASAKNTLAWIRYNIIPYSGRVSFS